MTLEESYRTIPPYSPLHSLSLNRASVALQAQRALALSVDDDAPRVAGLNAFALDAHLSGQQAWLFCGHADATVGGKRSLAFERNGAVDTLLASTVATMVRKHSSTLQLVLLNGCHSFDLGARRRSHARNRLRVRPSVHRPLVSPLTEQHTPQARS